MIKKALCLILLFIILIPNGAVCVSGDTKHDADLKEIFWGKNSTHYDTEELIVLQWAAYFAVDCIASSTSKMNDEAGLAILRNYGIEGVPNDVSDFQYKDNKFTNQHHERYTHLGWNLDYANDANGDLASWNTMRKPLLINAVRQVFRNGKEDLWSTIDFFDWFHQPITNMNERQIDSMAALIYYVHILGDHCYNDRSTVNDRIPLARKTESETNPSLIYDLKKHLQILFAEQTNSSDYRVLISKFDSIHGDIRTLLGNNDFPSTEQFPSYQQKANELMDELKKRIPRIMEDSEFFPKVFNEPAA